MRRARLLLAASSLAVTGVTLWVAGCGTTEEDCITNAIDQCKGPFSPRPDGGGTGGHIEPTCTGNPTDIDPATMAPKAFNKECSVFAWAGATNPAPDGTMGNPFPTLQAAIDDVIDGKNKGKWVITCNKDEFTENVTVKNSAQVFGAFDCTTLSKWVLDPGKKKTSLLGKDAATPALTLQNGGMGVAVQVKDFMITSPNATGKGGSSIAVAVDDITAALTTCDIKAGDGTDGDDGQAPTKMVLNGASAPVPDAATMNACINPGSLAGGKAAAPTSCDDGMSIAGAGGKGGNAADGDPGEDGQPADMTQGKGGSADTGSGCTDGTKGKDGDPGADGAAGPAPSSPETLSLAGIAGGDGGEGKTGARGQGGGGGGGRKSGNFCAPGNAPGNGASGGGAGAGGCGGNGGGAGKAGGSSIGIINMGTKLTLTEVTLTVGKGGKGGNGGAQQGGGAGGNGASGGAASGFSTSKPGCKGGDGGLGGSGGVGGGGRGGYSLGIVYANTPDAMPKITNYTPGAAGGGGSAGPGGPMTSDGAAGASNQCWDFSKKAPCM